jgi:hypothetical protein
VNRTATHRKELRPDPHRPRLQEIRGKLTTLPEGWTLEIKVLTEDPVHDLTGHVEKAVTRHWSCLKTPACAGARSWQV